MLILVLGDLHIPHRKLAIPEQFLELLKPGRVHKIIVTGNLCTIHEMKFLKTICSDIVVSLGDCDNEIREGKETNVLKLGSYSVGVIHGHQLIPWGDPERLAATAREMGVDILISGQTHVPSISNYEGRLLLNPGSMTGAYSCTSTHTTPSFMLLDVKNDQLIVYQYSINENEEVEVTQYNHTMV